MKLISWNIQGILKDHLKERTLAVCKAISEENADVVFLQEVVPITASLLEQMLPKYITLFGAKVEYFTGILLNKETVTCKESQIIPFNGSIMRRNLLTAKVKVEGKLLLLMTSHLESMDQCVTERINQLKTAFEIAKSTDKNYGVIFGGDMNLEENEVQLSGGLPADIQDVWELCGQPKKTCYTWDMTCNSNLNFTGSEKPRKRYDRLYLRNTSECTLVPKQFSLLGCKRLVPEQCYPSDHWGLMCVFNIASST